MTREEAKELLIHILMTYEPRDQYGDLDDSQPYEEAITTAIEALSEPKILTEDQVIRWCKQYRLLLVTEEWAVYKGLNSIDRPRGNWKTDSIYSGIEFYRCDQCDFRQSEKSRYCPNCGAKMVREDGEA